MNFKMTKIAASVAMVLAAGSAHAALNSTNLLTIQNDAVTTYAPPTTPSGSSYWTVSSNGPLADSFFTMGGSKTQSAIDSQYAFINGTAPLTLTGATQAVFANWTYYSAGGDNKTGTPNPSGGLSVISASGDTAIIDMGSWKVDWNGVNDVYMGSYAWSTGYVNGQGKLTCDTGSGCAVGSNYTLKYTATVPTTSQPEFVGATGFEGVKYYLELHGTVAAVPEASTYGMMLAGVGLVGFAVRRRKSVI